MPPTLQVALIVMLSFALAVALALLGAVWWRVWSLPLAETARLVGDLVERQRALEGLLTRLESERIDAEIEVPAAGGPPAPTPFRRVDRAEPSAIRGPTLITIPDLTVPSSGFSAEAAAELGRRFGTIWEQADAGASAEAIARGTGQPIGQVELILGLRRQLAAASEGRP